MTSWSEAGAVVRDAEPALWALAQTYVGPDGQERTRNGFLARVRVEDYGPGRIRPHERTHPGPKEDRLRPHARDAGQPLADLLALLRPRRRGLGGARAAHERRAVRRPRPTRAAPSTASGAITDEQALETVHAALVPAELLIADGHHRYETARVYAEEIGGEGEHRYVLMHLVALEDPGLTVFPTHRLISGLADDSARQQALRDTLLELFDVEELGDAGELPPPDGNGRLTMGYIDAHHKRPFRVTLKDQASADAALADFPEPYRRLDTAVLEALILTGPLGLTEDDISHFRGLGYSRSDDEALELVESGAYDAAFFLRGTPVSQIREIAAAGVNMPPKSTFFTPKVPTGLLFNPLS